MIHLISLFLFYLSICLANTETYLLSIPHYYNIPKPTNRITSGYPRDIQHLNTTHSVLLQYHIGSIRDQIPFAHNKYTISNTNANTIVIPYDTTLPVQKTLLVKINNYSDSIIESNDLLFIKLCWPATSAYDFRLSHEYIKTNELLGIDRESKSLGIDRESKSLGDNDIESKDLDLYLRIDYQFFGVTYNRDKFLHSEDELKFQLYINKLPLNWLPIPLELYDLIIYLVDIFIILVTQLGYIRSLLNI
ncbi:hypothetical protein KGF56_003250 [Candida oxycetoniae]|uniref:Uncharacterized protein n=1 Tax=Candida oxycetoniae TaxID=497107 RepID=A0AAI9SVS2_9ASCO|nr:uncharacterized protein KGF56_003250 [Candida oxycetoniae]KAI3403983.2 hypothetical protein KGF56_003250 [Candida oxycetoniae]